MVWNARAGKRLNFPNSKADAKSVAGQRTKASVGNDLPTTVPPLRNGDRLTRAEIERRYDEMPVLKKAELIDGEVYVGSLVHRNQRGQPRFHLVTRNGTYVAATPGLFAGDDTTIRRDLENEPGARSSRFQHRETVDVRAHDV